MTEQSRWTRAPNFWGAGLASSVEHVTLGLMVMCLSPVLVTEIT